MNSLLQTITSAKSPNVKMAPFRYLAGAFITATVLVLAAGPAAAISAKDVLEKMGEKERFSYVTGLVDMLSYQSVLAGKRDRAECIANKFYNSNDTWKLMMATFEKFSDKAPEGLVVVLMNRACGA